MRFSWWLKAHFEVKDVKALTLKVQSIEFECRTLFLPKVYDISVDSCIAMAHTVIVLKVR